VVYAADWQNSGGAVFGENWEDRWFIRVWTLVFFMLWTLFILVMIWKPMSNLTVPLLAAGAALLIRRGLRPESARAAIAAPNLPPAALAA
jgi:hypothetical protein